MFVRNRLKMQILVLLLYLLAMCSGCAQHDDTPDRDTALQHTASAQTATWDMDIPDVYVLPPTTVSISYTMPWARQFGIGFAVEARVLEVLPDIYALPEKTLDRENYRVLRLELVDTITGSGVPKEFYYLLDASYDPNLTQFDSLIISMRQMGIGSYMMFNTTQCRYDRFRALFASGTVEYMEEDHRVYPDPTELNLYNILSVLPFTDGVLDTSIYTRPGWDLAENMLDSYRDVFPVQKGHTLSQAKDAIRAHQEEFMANYPEDARPYFEKQRTVQYPDIYTDADTYQAFCSFDNGVFAQMTSREQKTVFCRIINGFYTNEYYSFTPGEETFQSQVQFTQGEIDALPDLQSVLNTAMQQVYAADPRSIDLLDGYYYKTERGIYGVIRAYQDIRSKSGFNINYILLPDGQVKQVSTKVLETYLAGDHETAELLQVWESISQKAYRSVPVYENRDNDYVSIGRITIVNGNFTITCADGWYQASEIKLTQIDPSAIGLDTLVKDAPKYWQNTDWNKETLLSNIRYAWQAEPDATNRRKSQYLLYMRDGTLLLVRGYDYTGLYAEPEIGSQIQLITQLVFDSDY